MVQLTRGAWAIVDERDIARVIGAGRWAQNTNGYAFRNPRVDGRQTNLMLHRFINGDGDNDVDHHNRDRLDNRRSNLRVATRSQNLGNMRRDGQNTSGYKGVSWHRQRRRWRATIKNGYRQRHLGLFADAIDAARAYDAAARAVFGEFALVNFPEAT